MGLSMILFLLTFLTLYGGINFYFFFRAQSLFHLAGISQGVFFLFTTLMILAPILLRVFEALHWEQMARGLAYIGYVWMAFVFLFFFLSVSLELIRAIHKLFVPSAATRTLKALTFGVSVCAAAVLVAYGYVEAQTVRVKHLEIETDKSLPEGKLRLVQISDVHVGMIIGEKRLGPILEKVSEAKPDLLVSTGDLLDGELDNIMHHARLFADLQPKYGKIAILGNHEYFAGLDRSLEFTRAAGFRLLRDDVVQVAGITIFGADDATGLRFGGSRRSTGFKEALAEKRDDFVLYLKHQPRVDRGAHFDLMLSGHTHGGQLWPFRFIVRLFFPRDYGLHRLDGTQWLYISRGTGTWGPPVRIFAPPEITVIDLVGKKFH